MPEDNICKLCNHSWIFHEESYCSFPTPGKGFNGQCFCCGEEGCCGKIEDEYDNYFEEN